MTAVAAIDTSAPQSAIANTAWKPVSPWPELSRRASASVSVAQLVRRGARYEPGDDRVDLECQRAEWRLALSRARLH